MAQETSPHYPDPTIDRHPRRVDLLPGAPAAEAVADRRAPGRGGRAGPRGGRVRTGGRPGSGVTGDMVQAVNQDRAAAGLGGLAWDEQLHGLAQSHANEIAASGSLWHSDLGSWLTMPWMGAWRSLGENLLVAPAGTNAWSAEDMWMGSGPHRANILGGFNRIGVGYFIDGAGRVWMVALFGTR